MARLIEREEEGAFRSVAASLAVLAGIAATDSSYTSSFFGAQGSDE